MANGIKISVVVCTYNRSESLAKALASIARSQVPESIHWEVLVIDNNSGDRTKEVVEEFCARYPGRFRYILESRQGLSFARNAGVRESLGEILVFTDDDVTVEPGWLQSLTKNLSGGEWVGAGGRILPTWSVAIPTWLPQKESLGMAPLVMFDLGLKPGVLTDPPFGANMAFHREMFEGYGEFRTDLGRGPDNLLGNEDTEFATRLIAAGERLRYEPSAVVYHAVSENRVRKDYFLRWWFDKARSEIREYGLPFEANWRIAGIPLIFLRRLLIWTLRWFVSLNSARRFGCKINVWTVAGRICECRRQFTQYKSTRQQSANDPLDDRLHGRMLATAGSLHERNHSGSISGDPEQK